MSIRQAPTSQLFFSIRSLYSKYSRALTFENLCQAPDISRAVDGIACLITRHKGVWTHTHTHTYTDTDTHKTMTNLKMYCSSYPMVLGVKYFSTFNETFEHFIKI